MTVDYAVEELLPHSGPMVLLSRILCCGEHSLSAQVEIAADSLFAEPEGVPAWVGLEYMGQAIAAMAGVHARQKNEAVRIGFLVSTRRYEPLVSHFAPGSTLTVSIAAVTFNTSGLRVFECSIYNGDLCLVRANLNVYMPEDTAAFMKENSP
jgi:predicted hotdog family 3-hydroxylacyl-ACP dehydratase